MWQDMKDHPVRGGLEVMGMVLSITVALVIMMTTPWPPMVWCYLGWNAASLCLLYGAVSRGSMGFSVLYALFLCIDTIGLWRTLA
jgi:hypothetical protein